MKCAWCNEGEPVRMKGEGDSYCARCLEPVKDPVLGIWQRRHFAEWLVHPDRDVEIKNREKAHPVSGHAERTKQVIAEIKAIGDRMMLKLKDKPHSVDPPKPRATVSLGRQMYQEREDYFDRKSLAADQGD